VNSLSRSISSLLLLLATSRVQAESYLLDQIGNNAVIGELSYATVAEGETLVDIARREELGYDELVKANPKVNRWVPVPGTKVILPKKHILPDAPRDGIVLNLAELRLYFYPSSERSRYRRVYTFPISIGRMDWKSPLGQTTVIKKDVEPAWYPPLSIQEEHAAEGDPLPKVVPGGDPTNPLGHYALRLGLPGYLIHGTDERKAFGIGMRVTHGCIRMYPEDIEELFKLVPVGTPVYFVDQPVKVGWSEASLLVEVHVPLKEDEDEFREYSHRVGIPEVLTAIYRESADSNVDLRLIEDIIRVGDGVPIAVGHSSSGLPPSRK